MDCLTRHESDIFFAKKFKSIEQALQSGTVLGVGAHPDDLEIMAAHGILRCHASSTENFVGVTCTSGSGSPRTGDYANYSDDDMVALRREEQRQAALLGDYAAMLQLGFPSAAIKTSLNPEFLTVLKQVIEETRPQAIYTHNLFDKHKSHVSVACHMIEAVRQLSFQPKMFVGCEVWRGLDWIGDHNKICLSIENTKLVDQLISQHRSQTAGGKNYAEATLGRMLANATFYDSSSVDTSSHQWYAVDYLPFLTNTDLSTSDYISQAIDQYRQDQLQQLID